VDRDDDEVLVRVGVLLEVARQCTKDVEPYPDEKRRIHAMLVIPSDDPKAWSLEYQTPSPVMKVSIPFEFKDVPLP